MILIADSHIGPKAEKAEEFFRMLDAFAETGHDIVFLGDIIDLWIALPKFNTEHTIRFLDWCRREKDKRQIGLVEGNHEFNVITCHEDCFSFSSPAEFTDGDVLFAHGDLVNTTDFFYLIFLRAYLKSRFNAFLFRTIPGTPALARLIKKTLNKINNRLHKGTPKDKRIMPEAKIKAYADKFFATGTKYMFLGHFHTEYRYEGENGEICQIVPAWKYAGKVAVFDPETKHCEIRHWKDISSSNA